MTGSKLHRVREGGISQTHIAPAAGDDDNPISSALERSHVFGIRWERSCERGSQNGTAEYLRFPKFEWSFPCDFCKWEMAHSAFWCAERTDRMKRNFECSFIIVAFLKVLFLMCRAYRQYEAQPSLARALSLRRRGWLCVFVLFMQLVCFSNSWSCQASRLLNGFSVNFGTIYLLEVSRRAALWCYAALANA